MDNNFTSDLNKETVYNQELSDESKRFLSELELEAQELAAEINSSDFNDEPVVENKTTDFDNADMLEAEELLKEIELENN